MSLPDELLDELLSAHLDGVLSEDECARVERMLRDDPAIGERLEALRQQRTLLKKARFAVPDLPFDFADQVVSAAIKRADEEGVDQSHPLAKAKTQSVALASQIAVTPRSRVQLVSILAGLAASILIGGLIVDRALRQEEGLPVGPDLIAEAEDDVVSPEESLNQDIESAADHDPSLDSMIASDSVATDSSSDSTDGTLDPAPLPDSSNSNVETPSPTKPNGPMIASNTNRDDVTVEVVTHGSELDLPNAVRPLNLLMVVQLNLSDIGRESDAVGEALAKLEFESSEQREVDTTLARAASSVQEKDNVGTEAIEIMLLESPIRKLDQLVNLLVSDQDGFASIEFTLISAETDAPLLKSVESVRTLDPTKIRHQGQSIPIVSSDRRVYVSWSDQLASRNFLPMSGRSEASMAVGMIKPKSGDVGPGQMANLLLLIR